MQPGSAQQIRDLIIDRLVAGRYAVGGKLPTARELAGELGVHHNTVAKAYRLLAEDGLVTTHPGRGTFVTTQVQGDGRITLLRIDRMAAEIALAARRLGFDQAELRALIDRQIASAYAPKPRGGAFIECNLPDVEDYIAEIEAVTGVRLSGILLDDALREAEEIAWRYDAIFTSLFHVKELVDALTPYRPDLRIVVLSAAPSELALEKIARIKPGSRVAVIASNPQGAHRFGNLVRTYAQVVVTVSSLPTDEEIRALAQESDVVVCTRSRKAQVLALDLPIPVIPLPFHISQQSALRVTETLIGQAGVASKA